MGNFSHQNHAGAAGQERATREKGAILVMFALSLTAILLVATLVVDGSQAYPQRRKMQNAADSAAIAGARALDRVKFSGDAWTTVAATASSVATNNGADAVTCTIITGTGSGIGLCSLQASVQSPSAAGVSVRASYTRPATFAKAVGGTPSITATVTSAASIQPLAGAGAPFVICGSPARGGYPILNSDNTINVAAAKAMGTVDIQSSKVPTCGAGSAFKGKLAGDAEVLVPGWVQADNGNGYDQQIKAQVVGATPCPTGGPFEGCDMLVPIADQGSGNGNKITMHVVAWAVFRIIGNGNGNPKYQGYFQSEATFVTGGISTNAVPKSGSTLRVIRLTA